MCSLVSSYSFFRLTFFLYVLVIIFPFSALKFGGGRLCGSRPYLGSCPLSLRSATTTLPRTSIATSPSLPPCHHLIISPSYPTTMAAFLVPRPPLSALGSATVWRRCCGRRPPPAPPGGAAAAAAASPPRRGRHVRATPPSPPTARTAPPEAAGSPGPGRVALAAAMAALPTPLPPGTADRFDDLTALLLEANGSTNLTAVRDADGVASKHIADALSLLPALDDLATAASLPRRGGGGGGGVSPHPLRVLDLGSGGGFPGLVLAIARPHWAVTLNDCVRKKTRWHAAAATALGLPNVTPLWGRAEALGAPGSPHRDAYDAVTARAVAELRVLAELGLPLVRVGGVLLAQKALEADAAAPPTAGAAAATGAVVPVGPGSPEVAAAATAMRVCGGALRAVTPVDGGAPLPPRTGGKGGDRARAIVVVEKVRPTPAGFPRVNPQKDRPL